jgi:hypothetical protein
MDSPDTIEISRPLLSGLVAQLERDGQDPTDSVLVLKHILRHGKNRAADLQAIAAAEVEASNKPQPRAENASEIVAAGSVDGHQRLNALREIAASNMEKST